MKKLWLALIPSMMLVACGDGKDKGNNEVITVESSTSSTTTTTIPVVLPDGEETPVIQETPTTSNPAPHSTATTVKPVAKPASGGVIGHISIPAIGLERDIREGIDLPILNQSPGHYPHSPKPCRAGNAAIAGHRTTYGAPFNKLDLLKNGDVINITTPEGDCTYRYLRTEIVSPTNVAVVMPKGGNFLTLTACHPKGSAAQRIAVTATLENVVVK
jgi:sortase A